MREALSLDDILLQPQFSIINSRLDTDLKTKVSTNIDLSVPLMSTNMSTITESKMAVLMNERGGVGAIHRFLSIEDGVNVITYLREQGVSPIIPSIGVGDNELIRGREYISAGADALLIDIAHGHSEAVFNQLAYLQNEFPNIDYIVGNIATARAAKDFLERGADGLRVGIGGGSRCTTRTTTGHGVPNLTALMDVVDARDQYFIHTKKYVPVIIDGGIKRPGDIVKALYFGADVACIGGLLAGRDETPGLVIQEGDHHFKKFYGMASKEAQDTHRGGMKEGTAAEGFSELVPYRGSARPVIDELIGGIRSGLTYSGARNIQELRDNGVPLRLSLASQRESKF